MRLLIFSGFLGSGKTTLIVALAKRLATAGHKTCFIVNEVGEVGIDQAVMRDDELDVWEITAGCICCQLGLDLVATLHEISERYRPAVVIVEASGVATPSGILEALAYYRGRPFADQRLITVVDPTRLQLLWEVMTPLVEAQIKQADEIVLSKLAVARDEEVTQAEAIVQKVNSTATTWRIDAGDEDCLQPLLAHLTDGIR
jgi:G3E family GTPase